MRSHLAVLPKKPDDSKTDMELVLLSKGSLKDTHRVQILDAAMKTKDMDNEHFLATVRARLDRCSAHSCVVVCCLGWHAACRGLLSTFLKVLLRGHAMPPLPHMMHACPYKAHHQQVSMYLKPLYFDSAQGCMCSKAMVCQNDARHKAHDLNAGWESSCHLWKCAFRTSLWRPRQRLLAGSCLPFSTPTATGSRYILVPCSIWVTIVVGKWSVLFAPSLQLGCSVTFTLRHTSIE